MVESAAPSWGTIRPMQKVLITAGACRHRARNRAGFRQGGRPRARGGCGPASGLNALRADSLAISTEMCDLADLAAIESSDPASHRVSRGARRTGQQCRHRRPHRAGGELRPARMGPRHASESRRHVQRDAAGDSASEEIRRRLHHQHVIGRGSTRLSPAQRLRRQQVGHHRLHEDAVDGAGRAWHSRQCHPAGTRGRSAHGSRAGRARGRPAAALSKRNAPARSRISRSRPSPNPARSPRWRCSWHPMRPRRISGQALSIDGDMHRSA